MPMKNRVTCVALSLWFILVLGCVVTVANIESCDMQPTEMALEPKSQLVQIAGTPHAAIIIDGDANFSDTALLEGWEGDGSPENPFIIEGLDIHGSTAGHAISISNTRANFIIRNCNLTGASVNPGYGVYLENVSFGFVLDNTFSSNSHALRVVSSTSIVIANNNATSNNNGVSIVNSDSVTVVDNIYVGMGGSSSGVRLDDSDSNTIINNTCTSFFNGIYLFNSHYSTVANNTCTGNTEGIFHGGSHSNTLTDNICGSNVDNGIYFESSLSSTLMNNTLTDNNWYGIYVRYTDNLTIVDNTITSNYIGILLEHSGSNTMTLNTINTIEIDFYSDLNVIQWNIFVDIVTYPLDNGFDNVFDYNYWSGYLGNDTDGDGIGDTSISFTGNSDTHPLMFMPTSPEWTSELPADQIAEFPYYYHFDLDAFAPAPIVWSVNDTLRFVISDQGVLESWGNLPVGDYGLEVTVSNIYGFGISITFHVSVVLDASNPPGWLIIPTDQVLTYGEVFDYQIIAIDPSGIDHWELNDTTRFDLSVSHYFDGSTARLLNSTVLGVGSYGLNITVYDIYGNRLSAVFSVTVITKTTTTTTTATTTEPKTVVPEGFDPVVSFVLGAGLGGGVVIVCVIVLLRKQV